MLYTISSSGLAGEDSVPKLFRFCLADDEFTRCCLRSIPLRGHRDPFRLAESFRYSRMVASMFSKCVILKSLAYELNHVWALLSVANADKQAIAWIRLLGAACWLLTRHQVSV